MFRKLLYYFLIFYTSITFAEINDKYISLDLNDVSIADTLQIIAKQLNENIIIDPQIHANVTLHLNQVSAQKNFYGPA